MDPLSQQPETAEAYNNRGEVKRIKGDLDGALADYDKAIELKPEFAAAYNNRALVKKRKGDLSGSLADYDKAITLEPDLAQIYINRGALKLSTDYAGAMADYDRAIELRPDFHEAYNSRGEARRVNGQRETAIADLSKAIELKPDFATAYNNRALAKLAERDYNGALSDCDKAISIKPDHSLYYVNRGEVKRSLEDFTGALMDFDRAVELKPDGLTYSHRALIKHANWHSLKEIRGFVKKDLRKSKGETKAKQTSEAKKIPQTENTLALRTNFSDETAWQMLCEAIQNPEKSSDDFTANVDFVSDRAFEGLAAEQLPSFISDDSRSFAFIIDQTALSNSEHPILVVDLQDEPGRTFRVISSELWAVENNLSIANMGFDEFADRVDKDGVFRGFHKKKRCS